MKEKYEARDQFIGTVRQEIVQDYMVYLLERLVSELGDINHNLEGLTHAVRQRG